MQCAVDIAEQNISVVCLWVSLRLNYDVTKGRRMHVYTMATATVKQKNIERLIARCESILAGKTKFQGKEWKLPKVWFSRDSLT